MHGGNSSRLAPDGYSNPYATPPRYLWDFGSSATQAGSSVSRSFGAVTPQGQPRDIRLTLTAGSDQLEVTRPLEIRNVAPTISLGTTPATVYSNDTLILNATASDPGGSDDPVTVAWDFHYDGTTFQIGRAHV